MVKEYINGQMVINIKVSGKIIKEMEKDFFNNQMEKFMKEIGRMI